MSSHHPEFGGVGLATDVDIAGLAQLRQGLSLKYQSYLPVDHIIDYSPMNRLVHADFEYIKKGPDSLNTERERNENGLTLSVSRPPDHGETVLGEVEDDNDSAVPEGMGYFVGVVPGHIGLTMPNRFLLFATFRRPVQTPWEVGNMPSPFYRDGSWAASLQIMTPGAELPGMGVTCQFTTGGLRMNLPRTEVLNNSNRRPFLAEIAPTLEAEILNAACPANFTLMLDYDRSRVPNSGLASLYVGEEVADSYSFDFFKMAGVPVVDLILAGVGTASGGAYKAQLDLVDLQVWGP